MASREIKDLCDQSRMKIIRFEAALTVVGIRFKGVDTYRSFAEQAALYSQGRTTPGRRVTNAPAGLSFHNVRRARDYFLRDADEDFDQDDIRFSDSQLAAGVWMHLGSVASLCGLGWGGAWHHQDKPHVQDQFCARCDLDVGSSGATHFNESGECIKWLEGS